MILIFDMFGGITPVLSQLEEGPMFTISYMSYARWLAEQLFVGHTLELSPVFRSYPQSFQVSLE